MKFRHVHAGAFMLAATLPAQVMAQATCDAGFVWREAFAGDTVCVSPREREQAANDNARAASRREPGGGAYGPATCRQGWVWREARSGDTVCVSPSTRDQVRADNAAAASRRVTSGGAPPPAGSPPAVGGERVGGWSTWGRKAGVEYRYRLRWNPEDRRPGGMMRVDFDLRNTLNRSWRGAVRSVDCQSDVLSMSRSVALAAHGTGQAVLSTPNCGTPERPFFKPNLVESVRID